MVMKRSSEYSLTIANKFANPIKLYIFGIGDFSPAISEAKAIDS